jgi:hypothetical protein
MQSSGKYAIHQKMFSFERLMPSSVSASIGKTAF